MTWKMYYANMNMLIFVLVVIGSAACEQYTPIVKLNGGQVRGIVQTVDGKQVHYFQAIRYGRANRFGKPKPVEPWSEVYNATGWRDACVQFGPGETSPLLSQTKTESEDCLFVNIWAPEHAVNRSVMFWIYGGGFEIGTIFSSMFDGAYMALHGDVVLVTVNYRLGPFGFLYGDTEDAPGNLGLYDQIEALCWVRQNIHHFGGDPNCVTIFGESAGSMSVGALILSPLTNGLFQRAIMQSGAPLLSIPKSKALQATKSLAQNLNCLRVVTEEMIKCLRNKSLDQIRNATFNALASKPTFVPLYGDALMPLSPVDALKHGKFNRNVDLMFGVNRDEGSAFVVQVIPQLMLDKSNLTKQSAIQDIKLMQSYNQFNAEEVAHFYIDPLDHPSEDDLKIAIAKSAGDRNIDCPTILFGEEYSKLVTNCSHIYSYRLMQPLVVPGVTNNPAWMGVMHGIDVFYLFLTPMTKVRPELYSLSKDMVRAWTNFAKTGQPGAIGSTEWKDAFGEKAHSSTTRFMALHSGEYKMVADYYKQTCNNFWKSKIFS